ncbi:MAG: molecular chaperone HtpG [Thermodesulfobacteriota bacterium]
MAAHAATHEFKAEISQLLEIITHSIYTNREIFLRELVSNASDALEKLRFLQSSGEAVADPDLAPAIAVDVDKDAKTITLSDTGLGMTRDELVANIGTIAHSGSAEFMARLAAQKQEGDKNGGAAQADALIGRFGVGFYSVFMVAKEVAVATRSWQAGEEAVLWTSDGTGSYTIAPAEEPLPRGARITIRLKDDAAEFADPERLREIIRRHSNFLAFPISVAGERVNTTPALWREPKFSITDEQYDEFYSFLTYDSQKPLDRLHLAVDAPVQFTGLVFAPDQDTDTLGLAAEQYGLDLYVRRVLISRSLKDLIPQYLGFLRGLVDAEDLPLNISRETLQENLLIAKIRSTLTKQVLNRLKALAEEDPGRYATFWGRHQRMFKLGYTDFANRDAFAELLRFNSSAHEDAKGLTSLAEYAGRMKDGQKAIYAISGPSREAVRLSARLEIFRRKGVEVLYLFDPIDEFILDTLRTYKEHKLAPAEQADIAELEALPDVEEARKAEELTADQKTALDGLVAAFKAALGERVADVRASRRLSDSPVCLVSPEGAMSSGMEKVMKVITKDTTPPRLVLEVNPDHAITRNLLKVYGADPADPFLALSIENLYDAALLLDGYLADPHALTSRTTKLLDQAAAWYAEIKKL